MKLTSASIGTTVLGAFLLGCLRAGEVAPLEITDPVSGIELVLLPAGRFPMGTPADEALREAQEIEHEVTLSRAFYMGRYEVTQEQWQRVLGEQPSHFASCPRCPVETVNLLEVQRFLEAVSEQGGLALRLPTEAEWESACRAGSRQPFQTGDTLDDRSANIDASDPYPGARAGGALERTTPVGSYPANAYGLYDLHGNVWEWTADFHCPYPEASVVDPQPECETNLQVIRGGSWHYGADSARCGLRYTHRPQDDGPSLGFRVALDIDEALANHR